MDIFDLRVICLEIFLQRLLGCAIVTDPGRLFHTECSRASARLALTSSHTLYALAAHTCGWRGLGVKVHVTLVRPVPDGFYHIMQDDLAEPLRKRATGQDALGGHQRRTDHVFRAHVSFALV